MNRPWIEYYKQTDPYCSPRHRRTSYKKTYTDLAALLKQYISGTPAKILDVGAGSLEQFSVVPELQKYNWIVVEPSLKDTQTPPCVAQSLDSLTKATHDQTVTVATILSVAQYLDQGELSENLAEIRLRFENIQTVIISDINIDGTSQIKDLIVYIWNACRYAYLFKAIFYLLKLRFGQYHTLRKNHPLRSYTHSDLTAIAENNGFQLKISEKNLGYNFHRTTIILTR